MIRKNIMFNYLIKKINKSKFKTYPFKHIYIENFFNNNDFKKLISSKEICLKNLKNDKDLFDALFRNNYKIINFPGCITDKTKYINWNKNKKKYNLDNNSICESAGMALRLKPENSYLKSVSNFFNSNVFNKAIAKKFNIKFSDVYIDGGIQKYLNGYEISPHPDIRKKALTYMININPNEDAENLKHHTQYLKFKKDKDYIKYFWENNTEAERPWLPWTYCKTVFTQKKNNSIVIISPSNDTLHAIKANYNHLKGQRTQLYGNLWFKKYQNKIQYSWKDFEMLHNKKKFNHKPKNNIKSVVKNFIPTNFYNFYKKIIHRDNYHFRDND